MKSHVNQGEALISVIDDYLSQSGFVDNECFSNAWRGFRTEQAFNSTSLVDLRVKDLNGLKSFSINASRLHHGSALLTVDAELESRLTAELGAFLESLNLEFTFG